MTTVAAAIPFRPPRHFDTAAEWLEALGGVPLHRIIFDPWPGTATEADLLRLVARDKLCELIDGTLVEKTVGLAEATIAYDLGSELGMHAKRASTGVVSGADSTLRMALGQVRLPDVCYFSRERLPGGRVPAEAIPTVSPDLVVEVLSEGNTRKEMAQKLVEYFRSGTRLAWFIQPANRTVAVYRSPGAPVQTLDISGRLDGEEVIPGFSMPVADLFRNVPPL